MPLTETAIKTLKPTNRTRKVTDERGLYLKVAPSGGKWWRFKYNFPKGGSEKRLSLGTYPDVNLKLARDKRDDMRTMLAKGIDPGAARKAQKAAANNTGNSFEAVAREFVIKRGQVLAADYAALTLRRLDMYVFPYVGAQPIDTITAPALLSVCAG
jgi:hypothetical protein